MAPRSLLNRINAICPPSDLLSLFQGMLPLILLGSVG